VTQRQASKRKPAESQRTKPFKGVEQTLPLIEETPAALPLQSARRGLLSKGKQATAPRKTVAQDDQRLRLLLESTDDIVVMQDLEGRCVYYHGPKDFGLKDEDLRGKMAADVLDIPTAVSVTVRVRHVISTGQGLAFEQRIERNGKTLWFLAKITPVFDDDGKVTATVLVARNITVRKQAEESLRTANILLERTFSGLNEAVFVMHSSLRTVTTCNAAVERIFGFKANEVVGRTMEFLFPDPSHYTAYLSRMTESLEQCGIFDDELQNLKRDGTIIPTEHTVTSIQDKLGNRTGLVVVVRDITERKRMEEVLLRSRNLESIGYLAGGIAHDFNNLLTTIIGNISLVKMHMDPTEKNYGRLDDAENACLRASTLTKQLITFSRGGTPIRHQVFVGGIVREEAAFCLNGSETSFAFDEPGGLWETRADEGQLRQAIDSIIRNAREAMQDRGQLTIEAENMTITPGSALPCREGRYVHLSFSDTGVGIPEENLPKIFDPYFTTKAMGSQKGMGLGLAITYSIVASHGGAITVESQEGAGTTFHMYLPADRPLERRLS
jgi:two-component system, cell cycle sensor histidine kinase and response regulator CckA